MNLKDCAMANLKACPKGHRRGGEKARERNKGHKHHLSPLPDSPQHTTGDDNGENKRPQVMVYEHGEGDLCERQRPDNTCNQGLAQRQIVVEKISAGEVAADKISVVHLTKDRLVWPRKPQQMKFKAQQQW